MGFITAEMIKEHLLPASESTIACMCGPPPMLKFAVCPALEKLGFTPEQCIQF